MPHILSQNISDTLNRLSFNDSLVTKTPSVFAGHSLKPIHQFAIFNPEHVYYWPSVFLFGALILFIIVKLRDPNKLASVFISVFNLQIAKQLFREDYRLSKRISILLSVIFLLTSAFMAYNINSYFGLILNGTYVLYQYLFFLGAILLMYTVKLITNFIISFIISIPELGKEYTFNTLIFCQTIGLVLFPIVVCMQYTKISDQWFLYPGLVACIILYILRIARTAAISMGEHSLGILYIFLYLCALEVLPFLVLIKFILVNF